MDQIDTRLYHDFKINKIYFKDHFIFKLRNNMRDVCHELFRKQYIQLRTHFIPLCIESHVIYYFNTLRMITILYHLYTEHEIYHMAYNNVINLLNDHLFIEGTMIQQDDYITFLEILRISAW